MSVPSTILDKVKVSLRISTDAFDDELEDLITAGLDDMGIAGVDGTNAELTNSLVLRAVTTYCKMNFGEPDEYERLKRSYDEQKAQLATATGWTTWGV